MSMAFYGDLAQRPSVPALVPPAVGVALAGPLGAPYMPAVLRTAYAAALLHRGDRAAAAIIAGLPDNADTADLRGQVAELAGDPQAALAAYARAGDFERAQRLIDASANAGRIADAARLERVLVDALTGAGQVAVRAVALWRLGQITQAQSQTLRDAARRIMLERASLGFYERALMLAPNEETYLLAAGEQALTLGNRAAAAGFYSRALAAVPDSADARAGLIRARP